MNTGVTVVVSTCDGKEFEVLFTVCASGMRRLLCNVLKVETLVSRYRTVC